MYLYALWGQIRMYLLYKVWQFVLWWENAKGNEVLTVGHIVTDLIKWNHKNNGI